MPEIPIDDGRNNGQVPILPVVDFHADKKVDLVDPVMLIDAWGKVGARHDFARLYDFADFTSANPQVFKSVPGTDSLGRR